MPYKLGKNIKVGNKILLKTGWKKVVEIKEKGIETSDGFLEFGWDIYGWKIK